MSTIPDSGLLNLLDEELRSILFPYGSFINTEPNQVIISQGESPHFYLVISGSFQVTIKGEKGVVALENVAAGDCFGEMCLFNNAGATANVTGLGTGRLWYTDSERFRKFLSDSDVAGCALLVGISTILSRRLRLANKLVKNSPVKSTPHNAKHKAPIYKLNFTEYSPDRDPTRFSIDECRLKAVGVLAYLTAPSLQLLSSYGEYAELEEDDTVMMEQSYVDRFFILLEGRLEVYTTENNSSVHLSFPEPGECFGEVSLLDPGPASASVQVVEPSILWSMGRDALRKLICDDPGLCGALLYGMAHGLELRLRHLDNLIAHSHGQETHQPLRSAASITASQPAQMTRGMFSVLKMARKVGSSLLHFGKHGSKPIKPADPVTPGTGPTAAPVSEAPTPPPDPLALFKAQDLVQLFCLNGRNVQLDVVPEKGETGVITIWNGKVLHARQGQAMGTEAFYSLILLTNPKLQIKEVTVEPPATITEGWESLLMEAAVRKDMQAAAANLA